MVAALDMVANILVKLARFSLRHVAVLVQISRYITIMVEPPVIEEFVEALVALFAKLKAKLILISPILMRRRRYRGTLPNWKRFRYPPDADLINV